MAYLAMWLPSDKYGIKSPFTMKPVGIVVHNTANDASAINEVTYMNRNNNPVSYHVAIDDINVVQAIPFNRNAWHAGATYANRNMIGIEICYSRSGGSRFTKAEKESAKYIATLCKQYGWGIDKVQTHQQQNKKYCPHRTLDTGWQRFLNMVKAEMEGTSVKKERYELHSFAANRKIFDNETKKYLKDVWVSIDGKSYRAGPDELLLRGWQDMPDRGRVYFNPPNHSLYVGWASFAGRRHYFRTKNGAMLTDLQTIDGSIYYFDKEGVMQTGWQDVNGKRYFFLENGAAHRGVGRFGARTFFFHEQHGYVCFTDKDGVLK